MLRWNTQCCSDESKSHERERERRGMTKHKSLRSFWWPCLMCIRPTETMRFCNTDPSVRSSIIKLILFCNKCVDFSLILFLIKVTQDAISGDSSLQDWSVVHVQVRYVPRTLFLSSIPESCCSHCSCVANGRKAIVKFGLQKYLRISSYYLFPYSCLRSSWKGWDEQRDYYVKGCWLEYMLGRLRQTFGQVISSWPIPRPGSGLVTVAQRSPVGSSVHRIIKVQVKMVLRS